MDIYWTKIHKIIDETTDIKTYLLDCPQNFVWEEGAHTHFALKGFNDGEKPNKSLVRHMSISTLPNENSVGITTRLPHLCSPFKTILKGLTVGDEVALFKIHSNVQLQRTNKNIYLLSSGVGLATFRPVVLSYLEDRSNISSLYSLNVNNSEKPLFDDVFQSNTEKDFTAQFVTNRSAYYEQVKQLANDKEGIFYIVGSDEFIVQNIELLNANGITRPQIILDKREQFIEKFFNGELAAQL